MNGNREILLLCIDHVTKKLAEQQQYLIALRNQAGISAAVSGLIATLFGTLFSGGDVSFRGDAMFGMAILPLLGFLFFSCSIAFSAMVVVHYKRFTFSFNGRTMLEKHDQLKDEYEFLRKYIKDGEWFFRDNEAMIGDLQTKLWFAMVFGFVQIIPWFGMLMEYKNGR